MPVASVTLRWSPTLTVLPARGSLVVALMTAPMMTSGASARSTTSVPASGGRSAGASTPGAASGTWPDGFDRSDPQRTVASTRIAAPYPEKRKRGALVHLGPGNALPFDAVAEIACGAGHALRDQDR